VFTAQLVRHPDALQRNGVQSRGNVATQLPEPLHVSTGSKVAPLHAAAAQGVPDANSAHWPLPSHSPVRPQEDTGSAAHSLSGSVPAFTGPQAPSAPWPLRKAEQAMQGAVVHADSQQTPSTQKPVLHSAEPAHAAPLSFLTKHCPPPQ
jgi:hypothetical protein